MGISSSLGSSALLPAGLGHRNKIINGDMRIAQRGTSTVTGSGSAQYPVDRWVVYNGTGTVTFAQSTIAPAGYTNSLNATVTATGSYGTSGYTEIGQMIEGFNCQDLAWGTASAKLITVSFWVRSSVTGTYNVAFQNSGQNRSYIASFTINAANTWEYETIQIPGDTSGTWLTDSGVGLRMWLQLGMGTNYDTTGNTWTAGSLGSTSGSIDFAANSGATFYVTGVQVEQNLQPTPFEQRLIGVELALCQRYYYRTVYNGTSNTLLNGTGNSYSASSQINLFMLHPVPMRSIVSTLESANIGASDLSTADSGTASVVTGFTGNSSIFGTRVRLSATTSWNGPAFPIVFSGGYFALGAEL
jgi:hypothetical protein